jgi:hypothetical protein
LKTGHIIDQQQKELRGYFAGRNVSEMHLNITQSFITLYIYGDEERFRKIFIKKEKIPGFCAFFYLLRCFYQLISLACKVFSSNLIAEVVLTPVITAFIDEFRPQVIRKYCCFLIISYYLYSIQYLS